MFRLTKLILTGLTIFMIAALTACSLGQTAEQPTPTAVDVTAIYLSAAASAQAQMTLNAPTITSTFTVTISPSETPVGEATNTPIGEVTNTNTPIGVPVEATSTLTPIQTPLLGTTAIPSLTPPPASGGATAGPVCKNAAFDGDVTIPDGTVFKPWEKFVKIWKVRNTGTCRWDDGFSFAAVSGPASMGSKQGPYKFRSAKDFIGAGEAVDIAIEMYAPGDPGEYVAHWHMYDDTGKPFGGDFTVVIKVVK